MKVGHTPPRSTSSNVLGLTEYSPCTHRRSQRDTLSIGEGYLTCNEPVTHEWQQSCWKLYIGFTPDYPSRVMQKTYPILFYTRESFPNANSRHTMLYCFVLLCCPMRNPPPTRYAEIPNLLSGKITNPTLLHTKSPSRSPHQDPQQPARPPSHSHSCPPASHPRPQCHRQT